MDKTKTITLVVYATVLSLLGIMATSCGDSSQPQGSPARIEENPKTEVVETQEENEVAPPSSFAVSSKQKLPACNADMDGTLSYVMNIHKFFTCDSNSWVEIDMNDSIEQKSLETFEYNGREYFWSAYTYGANMNIACPSGFSSPLAGEVQAIIDDGILFEMFPSATGSTTCTMNGSGMMYNGLTSSYQANNSSTQCHRVCIK